jgi:hypothetical protein
VWQQVATDLLDAAGDAMETFLYCRGDFGAGVSHEAMNFPDSFSNKIIIFLGCFSFSKDTITVSRIATAFNVS